jgi:hypothetical protein
MYFINATLGGRDAPKATVSVSLTQGEYYVFESVGFSEGPGPPGRGALGVGKDWQGARPARPRP